MLLVNVHQLDVIFADSVVLRVLKDKVQAIWCILGLQCDHVFILGTSENLCEGIQVDSKSNVAVAAVWGETVGSEKHGYQGNMGIVHCLESDTSVIAVEVAILDEILHGLDDLLRVTENCQ